MSNIIDSIRMSGTTYAISDSGGTKVVEITQSDYDNLPTSAKTANIMYVITDAEPFDVSNYYTKAETSGATELATAFAATQPKLSAGTNITIDANNVISAEGGGGGGITSGEVQTMIDNSLSGYVYTADNGKQDIYGSKTFIGEKRISFTQGTSTNKLGFTIYGVRDAEGNSSQLGAFELNPTAITESNTTFPLLSLGHYRSGNRRASVQSYIGFRQYDYDNSAAYHLLAPLPQNAKTSFSLTTNFQNFYMPLGIKVDNSTMVKADSGGVMDISSYIGSITIDPTLDKNSSNAVANSAITNNTLSGGVESNNYFRSVRFRKNNGEVAFYQRFAAINGNSVMVDGTTEAPNFQLVGTSAITTSVTSASTDVQVPSAKAVYDALQEGGGGNSVVELTQAAYDALVTGGTVDPNTFYVITDAQEIDTDDYYTKSQTSGATELATAFGAKLDATAYTPTDLSNYYTKSETSGSSEISTALATKLNVSDFNTYSGTVNTSLSSKASQNDLETVSASTASNTTALGGLSLVKLTQSAYDALSPNYDSNTLYVIVN